MTKMAKIYTLFMTKTANSPDPLRPHIPIRPISGSTTPSSGFLGSDLASNKSNVFRLRYYLERESILDYYVSLFTGNRNTSVVGQPQTLLTGMNIEQLSCTFIDENRLKINSTLAFQYATRKRFAH